MDKICLGYKKGGDRCHYKATYGDKCGIHVKMSNEIEVMNKICSGYKKDGNKCNYKAIHGDTCGFHMKKIEIIKSESVKEVGDMNMNEGRIAITFTYGMIENGVRMQQLGELEQRGYRCDELMVIANQFKERGGVCEYIRLNDFLPSGEQDASEAGILIVRGGINILGVNADELLKEQMKLPWDTKKLNKGLISNSIARRNLCYADISQENNYDEFKGKVPPNSIVKGTVINFNSIELTQKVRTELEKILPKHEEIDGGRCLLGEGNYYYNDKCGIGYHGDTERKTVICCSLGSSTNLDFQWFKNRKPIGSPISLTINHGDIYVMSEATTGNDWKKYANGLCTLRHSAGALKYRTLKTK
jgi:hypothetical protein